MRICGFAVAKSDIVLSVRDIFTVDWYKLALENTEQVGGGTKSGAVL